MDTAIQAAEKLSSLSIFTLFILALLTIGFILNKAMSHLLEDKREEKADHKVAREMYVATLQKMIDKSVEQTREVVACMDKTANTIASFEKCMQSVEVHLESTALVIENTRDELRSYREAKLHRRE